MQSVQFTKSGNKASGPQDALLSTNEKPPDNLLEAASPISS